MLPVDMARGLPRAGPVWGICWRSQSVAGRGACRSALRPPRGRSRL